MIRPACPAGAALAALLAGALGCSRAPEGSQARRVASPAPREPSLSAAVSFRCLWWSSEQMNGLDPNHPPPKTTEVVLSRWEYSDPVGVPHPDSVDVVVDLRNESETAVDGVAVETALAWKRGPIEDGAQAAWGEGARQASETFSVPGLGTHAIRIPVDVASEMKRLEPSQEWPWSLRARISVRVGQRVVAEREAELPITPGD